MFTISSKTNIADVGTSLQLDMDNVRYWHSVKEGVVGWLRVNLQDPAISVTSDPDDERLVAVYGRPIPRLSLQILSDIVHHSPPSDILLLQLDAKGTRYNKVLTSLESAMTSSAAQLKSDHRELRLRVLSKCVLMCIAA